uniref:Uncharacterized protein n=1 Tax=Glossina pallidipes TaxID=7398 RepID=A0A1A9ZWC1_GLOPL
MLFLNTSIHIIQRYSDVDGNYKSRRYIVIDHQLCYDTENAPQCAVNHAAGDVKAATKRIILETVDGLTSFMPANGEDAIIISSTYNAMILVLSPFLRTYIQLPIWHRLKLVSSKTGNPTD